MMIDVEVVTLAHGKAIPPQITHLSPLLRGCPLVLRKRAVWPLRWGSLRFRQLARVLDHPAHNWMTKSCYVSCFNALEMCPLQRAGRIKHQEARDVDSRSPNKENVRAGRAAGKDLAGEYIRSWRWRGFSGCERVVVHVNHE